MISGNKIFYPLIFFITFDKNKIIIWVIINMPFYILCLTFGILTSLTILISS